MKRKLLITAFAILFLLSLSACGKKEKTAGTDNAPSSPSPAVESEASGAENKASGEPEEDLIFSSEENTAEPQQDEPDAGDTAAGQKETESAKNDGKTFWQPESDSGSCSHSYSRETVKQPDCKNEGLEKYTCTKCGDTFTNKIPALGHSVITDKAVDATCTSSGLTEGSHCGRCGEIITPQMVIPATGHNFVNGVCTVCGTKDGTEKQDTQTEEDLILPEDPI